MSTIVVYLAVGAGAIAIMKILFSSRGKVTIPGGLSISWGK